MKKSLGIFIFVCLWISMIYGNGPWPESRYYFAYLNKADSTIHVILDGNFYYHKMNLSNPELNKPELYGKSIANPTTLFESAFMKKRYNHPSDYDLVEQENWDSGRLSEITNSRFIPSATGLSTGQYLLIAKPSRDGSGAKEILKIERFLYHCYDHVIDIAHLIAKTEQVNKFDEFSERHRFLVAVVLGRNPKEITQKTSIDTIIPPKVKK